jgi:FAD/FMN-containing dehydrogenase
MFGPRGEATIPSNAMVPFSRARELATAVDAAVAVKRDELDAAGVFLGNNYLVTRHVFGVEPLINYPSQAGAYRLAWVPDEMKAQFERGAADPAARDLALALRRDLLQRFRELGAVHIQIGRTYPFREALADTRTWSLLEELKQLVDPDGIINPGVLALAPRQKDAT